MIIVKSLHFNLMEDILLCLWYISSIN